MTARQDDYEVMRRLNARGIDANRYQANTLRRAAMTISRWNERECGDENGNCIERDEKTGIPYAAHYGHDGHNYRYRIADREKGAKARVAAVCKALGAYFYLQGDPRGCSLYVSAEPIADNDYTRNSVAIG